MSSQRKLNLVKRIPELPEVELPSEHNVDPAISEGISAELIQQLNEALSDPGFTESIPEAPKYVGPYVHGSEGGLDNHEMMTIDSAKQLQRGGLSSNLRAIEIFTKLMKGRESEKFLQSPAHLGKLLVSLKKLANILEAQKHLEQGETPKMPIELTHENLEMERFNEVMKKLHGLCQENNEVYSPVATRQAAIMHLWREIADWVKYYFENTDKEPHHYSEKPTVVYALTAARRLRRFEDILDYAYEIHDNEPDCLLTIMHIASAYYNLGDWDNAFYYSKLFLDKSDSEANQSYNFFDPEEHTKRAVIIKTVSGLNTGEYKAVAEDIDYLRENCSEKPRFVERVAARAYFENGDLKLAAESAEFLLESEDCPHSELLLCLAVFSKLRDYSKIKKCLLRLETVEPEPPKERFLSRFTTYFITGDREMALENLRRFIEITSPGELSEDDTYLLPLGLKLSVAQGSTEGMILFSEIMIEEIKGNFKYRLILKEFHASKNWSMFQRIFRRLKISETEIDILEMAVDMAVETEDNGLKNKLQQEIGVRTGMIGPVFEDKEEELDEAESEGLEIEKQKSPLSIANRLFGLFGRRRNKKKS